MAKKFVIPPTEVTKYPSASVGANFMPTMRTPDDSYPLSIAYALLDSEGNPTFEALPVMGDDGKPLLDDDGSVITKQGKILLEKTIVERIAPPGKKTLCGLKSTYHSTWAYSLAHGATAFIRGCDVKGRCLAITFAKNYGNSKLQLPALWASGKTLVISFNASTRGMPETLGEKKTSTWIIPAATVRDNVLAIATMVALVDKYTPQETATEVAPEETPEAMEFEI